MKLALLFGSYREPSFGRRILPFLSQHAKAHEFSEVITLDAKAIGLPMLDKKFEEFAEGAAPASMLAASQQLKDADAYVMVAGEYNASIQPGLANLMDHFRTEYTNKPVGFACYSMGALGGARVSMQLRPFVANLGMFSIPTVLGFSAVHEALSEDGAAQGAGAAALEGATKGFLAQLAWAAEALKAKR